MDELDRLAKSLSTLLGRDAKEVKKHITSLLDNSESLIKPTKRVKKLRKQTQTPLTDVFNFEHLIPPSASLFEQYSDQIAVIFGHKFQGKSQFLFFLMRLLQEMGEGVVLLDTTAFIKTRPTEAAAVRPDNFCVKYWKHSFEVFLDQEVEDKKAEPEEVKKLKGLLETFAKGGTRDSWNLFERALKEFAYDHRVWMIIDEIVEFETAKFPIDMPGEQEPTPPFYYIVTGSAGIATFVDNKNINRAQYLIDLPTFTKEESFDFAIRLAKALGITDLAARLGEKEENVADFLESQFGGVPGYIAESFLGLAQGKPFSDYAAELDERVRKLIVEAAKREHISKEQLSRDWLHEINSEKNTWACVRESGLCGREPPPGIIFSMMLEWLNLFAGSPLEKQLEMVLKFRSKFREDPGLDGGLLELEEITKLKLNRCLEVVGVKFIDAQNLWVPQKYVILLPAAGRQMEQWSYEEASNLVSGGQAVPGWHLVLLAAGFTVLDVLLVFVDEDKAKLIIYAIQITRASDPFKAHFTLNTCSDESKKRLTALFSAIQKAIMPTSKEREEIYVMYAPKCAKDKHVAHGEHTKGGFYYFGPPEVLGLSVEPEGAKARKEKKRKVG